MGVYVFYPQTEETKIARCGGRFVPNIPVEYGLMTFADPATSWNPEEFWCLRFIAYSRTPSAGSTMALSRAGAAALTWGAEPPWVRHTLPARMAGALQGSPFDLRAVHRCGWSMGRFQGFGVFRFSEIKEASQVRFPVHDQRGVVELVVVVEFKVLGLGWVGLHVKVPADTVAQGV